LAQETQLENEASKPQLRTSVRLVRMLMIAAQRVGVQPPRARGKKQHQKRHDLAREAVGLQRRVGWLTLYFSKILQI